MRERVVFGLALVVGFTACDREDVTSAPDGGATVSSALVLAAPDDDQGVPAASASQKKASAKQAGERIDIPAGRFTAGSVPGDHGRDPVLEPAMLSVDLDAFTIDRLPFPNDPNMPMQTGVSRARASELCKTRGGRLCSELEWERACKGPEGSPYAGAKAWDPSCATSPETCASGFGVLAMSAAGREWTASDIQPIKKLQPRAAAVRGARTDAGGVDHRCARRRAVDPSASSDDLGFRCCYGKPNTAIIASPKWLDAFKRIDLPRERLATILGAVPRLQSLAAGELKYFRDESAGATVRRRGARRSRDAGALDANTYLTTKPMLWNPVPGEVVLLVAGRSGGSSFVLAFHQLPGERYRVASTFIMEDEPGPVVFVYNPFRRRKLEWTTCLGCYGGMGNITHRSDNRVVITQR